MVAPYAYGIIACTESRFVTWISAMPRSWRLFLVDFLVRMWRLNAIERLILPLPRTRKRFFAPLLVFILGMMRLLPFSICCPRRCSPGETLFGPSVKAHDRLRACSSDALLS